MVNKTTLAVIGGSRAYDLLKSSGFGAVKGKPHVIKTPFGNSAPVRLFSSSRFSYFFLSRHGEKGYEVSAPYVNYRANIWALKKLGVERIVSWSQPGAISPKIKPGDFILPHDIIDMTKNRPANFFEGTGLGFIRMSEPFCPEVRSACAHALSTASFGGKQGSLKLAWHANGVYVCTEGPRLETPAEIRMFARWGGDLVGMTLVPEAFLARQMEMCYGAICLSSNFAEGVVARGFKEGELFEGMLAPEESAAVEASVQHLPRIIGAALGALAGMKRECKCGLAMERYRKKGLVKDLLKAAKLR
ncbi:MAG: MTAP family purine nucleoside phosphorylase [Nitrospinae bacterium]|nr:MTAP family purine nucleoside phosphorylase [Nitrospinota bacterium]